MEVKSFSPGKRVQLRASMLSQSPSLMVGIDNQQRDESLIVERAVDHGESGNHAIIARPNILRVKARRRNFPPPAVQARAHRSPALRVVAGTCPATSIATGSPVGISCRWPRGFIEPVEDHLRAQAIRFRLAVQIRAIRDRELCQCFRAFQRFVELVATVPARTIPLRDR